MQRSSPNKVNNIFRKILSQPASKAEYQPCDVFVNHRGIDTKRNIAGLLYTHLRSIGFRPFLDSKSMKPGDKLFDKINTAIRECKVGIAVFSPMYCDSVFCLHELSLMMKCRIRVVPIFVNVKPSELHVKKDYGTSCSPNDLNKYRLALEEAKNIVGLTFDTSTGDWPEFLAKAMDVVIKNMVEVEEEGLMEKKNQKPSCFSWGKNHKKQKKDLITY